MCLGLNPIVDLYIFLLLNINIYGFQMHVWSLVVYSSFVALTFLKIRTHTGIIRAIVLSFFVGLICNDTYESTWFFMMTNKINLYYFIVTVILIIIFYVLSRKLDMFELKRITLVLLFIEILSFFVLSYTDHYVFLRVWMFDRTAFDPHNWIWMINKALGVWYIYPSIITKTIHTTVIKRSNKTKNIDSKL